MHRAARKTSAREFVAKVEHATRELGAAVGERIDFATAGPLTRDVILERAGVAPIAGADGAFDEATFLRGLGLDSNAGLTQIGEALRKAAVTTGTSAAAMLDAQQARNFIVGIQDRDTLSSRIRVEPRDSASGSIEKIGVANGKIRAASENADDGYRAEPTFGTVPYQAVGIRLPWEVTLQFLRYNIEGASVEEKIWNLMLRQFAIDLGRLDVLGDTGSGDPSLSINDGWLKQIAASGVAHRVNGGDTTFGVGWPNKAHLFAAIEAMPDKYLQADGADRPVWIGSPSLFAAYQEYLTDRATGAGDQALSGGGTADLKPLGYERIEVPAMPSSRLLFTPPRNLIRVLTTQIERYKVGPETDWELATRRKRGYVFFVDHDSIVEEMDAVVDLYNLGVDV